MRILAVLLLSGCSIMGHQKVEGWPELKVIEHYVSTAEMRDQCARYMPWYAMPEACSEFRFKVGECHIWYATSERPPQQYIIDHERLHCHGYDHIGSDAMARMIKR